MKADELTAVIAGGETYTVEFKRARKGQLDDGDVFEAVVCLANGDGGVLLLGVEDDGTISGAESPKGGPVDPISLSAFILNKTEPPVACTTEVVVVDGRDVVIIEVPKAPTPTSTKSGLFRRRSLRADGSPECVAYLPHEIVSAGLSAQGRDYAETVARGATSEMLDPREFERFRRLCASGKGDRGLAESSASEILRALRLTKPETEELTLGAILLFGGEAAIHRYAATAELLFQEERNGVLTFNEELRAPLFRMAERVAELLEVRNSEQELLVGIHRVGIPRLPAGIVREAVANALVHRDYSELGPVRVQLSESRLRITSPGGFPPGITLSNVIDESKPRSVVLAEAFKRAGLVDRYGRGVPDIYRQLLRLGRSGPDYSASNERMVTVSIPTSDSDLEMVRFVIEHDDADRTPLTLTHLRILHELKAVHDASVPELSDALALPEARVREDLARLTEEGIVEPRGTGRARRYYLTVAFYRNAHASEYVRLRGVEPIQQEQMVLSYVDRFGSITRSKAAELCRLSPQQARLLLRSLVLEGELELRGEKRGAHYVRASNKNKNDSQLEWRGE
ncbi:MAG: AAA family ATPase [Leifsonia xyli]|nr:MAG: AAA family ATPase [Leifsonia xyli]